ncbi:MAG TPA: serine/threonine-protein kinase [Myxococcota bacterium]
MTGGDDDNESPERTEVVSYEEAVARRKKRLGRYVLERIIAEGGMAEIWLASAEGPGQFSKKVVVKRIRPELVRQALRQGGDDGANLAMEMFVREARLLASLEHRHIVQVFEFGVQPARRAGEPPEHFIVMEVLEGLSLRDLALRLWQAKRPLPVEAIVQIVADACLGLEHAHRLTDERGQPANLVHRDISPDNIFVTTTGVAKLLDFGIAKREDWSNLTVAGELKGKVPYMSPEQLKGLRVDGRTDLFAVGIVLYWLLGGRRPFDGPSDIFTMKAILDDEPTPLRTLNARVPALVADVVASCLAKEPEQRISSAAALHDALSMVLLSARGTVPDLGALVLGAMELPHTSYELVPEIAAAPVQLWPGMPGYSSSSSSGTPVTSSSSSAGQSRSERRAPSFDKDSREPSTALAPEIGRKVSDVVVSRPSSSALPPVPSAASSSSGNSDDPRTLSLSLDDLPKAPPSQPVVDPVVSSSAPRVPTPGSMPALNDPAATIGLADFTGDDLATVPLQALHRADNAHLDLPPSSPSSSKSSKASPSPSLPSPSSIEQAGPTSALNPALASTVMEQAGPTSTSTNALPPALLDAAPTMLDMPLPAAVVAAEAEARARQPSRSIPSSSSSSPSSSSPSLSRAPSRALGAPAAGLPTAPVRRRRRRWRRFVGPLLAGGGSALVVIVGLSWALGLWPTAEEPVVGVVPVAAAVVDAGVVAAPIVDAGAAVVAAVVDAGAAVVDAGDVVTDAGVVDGAADAGGVEVAAVPADDVDEDDGSDDEPEPTPSTPSTTPTKKPKTPKKSKKPAAVVAKGRGFLVVQVRPWAKVSVDGTPMGTTPLPALSVSAGRHKVKLEHEGQVKTRTIDVSANTTATVQVVFDRTTTP